MRGMPVELSNPGHHREQRGGMCNGHVHGCTEGETRRGMQLLLEIPAETIIDPNPFAGHKILDIVK
jgi:hypothetical protein